MTVFDLEPFLLLSGLAVVELGTDILICTAMQRAPVEVMDFLHERIQGSTEQQPADSRGDSKGPQS